MEQNRMKKGTKKARNDYMPPRIEVHAIVPNQLMETSFYTFEHNLGDGKNGESDHHGGSDGGVEYGAKAMILGQEFSFSDIWEE